MNDQEIFDRIVGHLRAQGSKAEGYVYDETGEETYLRCLLQDDNGKKCAIGCLIEDDEYSSALEELTLYDLFEVLPEFGKKYINSLELLQKMQLTHDQIDVTKWEKQFKILANEFGLIYSPIDFSTS